MDKSMRMVQVSGLVACIAYAVVGALQILVWNPLAAVPSSSLPDTYRSVEAARESMGVGTVIIWAVVGIALAAAVAGAAQLRRIRLHRSLAALYLTVLALGAPSHFFASVPAGMGLADTFMISGGAYSPWGMMLYLISVAAFLALMLLGPVDAMLWRLRAAPPQRNP
ncbi:hypothetical protein [Arthrobacter antioxidans]|uniref:hypothetical protein n=1 Tax=Arthrobacter antioxidans TaxID=2895818 RepID=UPI001FFE6C81|nr:hypothetical protein [Arthrobacter antioxidans]